MVDEVRGAKRRSIGKAAFVLRNYSVAAMLMLQPLSGVYLHCMMARVDTRLAEMFLTENGRLIEVHYREGMDLDEEGLMEVQLRRGELTKDRCAMIAFFHAGTLSDVKSGAPMRTNN